QARVASASGPIRNGYSARPARTKPPHGDGGPAAAVLLVEKRRHQKRVIRPGKWTSDGVPAQRTSLPSSRRYHSNVGYSRGGAPSTTPGSTGPARCSASRTKRRARSSASVLYGLRQSRTIPATPNRASSANPTTRQRRRAARVQPRSRAPAPAPASRQTGG